MFNHKLTRLGAIACVLSAIATLSANAGQPLATDNVALVDAKACQLEAWVQSFHGGREVWALPACNPLGGLEITAGGARTMADDGDRSSLLQLQAKTVLIPPGDRAWSVGASAGAQRDTGAPHGRVAFQTYYGKALASFNPSNNVEVDVNLGLANTYGVGTYALAGAALQYALFDHLQLLSEIFRDTPGRSKFQVGARYVAIRNRLEVYLSYGNRIGGESTAWWTIAGIRVQWTP